MATLELEYTSGIRIFEFGCQGSGEVSPRDRERIRKSMGVYIGPVGVPDFDRAGLDGARVCFPSRVEPRDLFNFRPDTHHEAVTCKKANWCEAVAVAQPYSGAWREGDMAHGAMEVIAFLSGPYDVGSLCGLPMAEWCEALRDDEGLRAVRLNGTTLWSERDSAIAEAARAVLGAAAEPDCQ